MDLGHGWQRLKKLKKSNKNVMESLKNNKNVATSDLSESAGSRLAELCRELFEMLETYEVSDFGREFHPTTIQSCRSMQCARLAEILPEMKKLSFENKQQ